jgi:hypothetical protein
MSKDYLTDDSFFICMRVMSGASDYTMKQIVEWFRNSKNGQYRFIKDYEILNTEVTLKEIDSTYPGVSVITVVRNPWARAWTGYNDLQTSENIPDEALTKLNLETFESFLDGLRKIPYIHKFFQTEWTEYTVGNTVRSADYIFKEELIVEEFKIIEDYFKTPQPLDIHPPIIEYKEFYNNTTQALVSEIFKKDIENLSYTF